LTVEIAGSINPFPDPVLHIVTFFAQIINGEVNLSSDRLGPQTAGALSLRVFVYRV